MARLGGPRFLGGTLGEYTFAQRRSFTASVVHFGQTLYLDDPPRAWYLALLCVPHSRGPVGRSSCDQCLWLSLMLWKQNRNSGARPDSHCSLRAALVCAASSSSALSMGVRTNEAISIAAEPATLALASRYSSSESYSSSDLSDCEPSISEALSWSCSVGGCQETSSGRSSSFTTCVGGGSNIAHAHLERGW